MPSFRFVLALGLASLTGACTTGQTIAEVTRFHLGQPIARGTVAIQQQNNRTAAVNPEFAFYAGIVADRLYAVGFTAPSDPAQDTEFIAILDYDQTMREGPARHSPVSIGIGGGTGGYHGGVGGGINFPIGKAGASRTVINKLSLQLKRRSDNSVIWEGRAVTEVPEQSANASLGTAVPKLASALLANFPGPSGQTIRIKLR